MYENIYLSLGSNKGNREEYLLHALHEISGYEDTTVVSVSSLYETEPVHMKKGKMVQNFLNLCCTVQTGLAPFEMLESVQKTEQRLGRTFAGHGTGSRSRGKTYSSRTIDIDMLLYGERIIYTKELVIPHPLLHERLFVLEPFSEIAGTATHPLFRLTVNELKHTIKNKFFVRFFKKTTVSSA